MIIQKAAGRKKVVVGMSGGVDSSVAAYLLKEQGYEVIGVTMEIWPKEQNDEEAAKGGCCGASAADDARRVAYRIGIPHYVMNFRKEFEENVIRYFADEYRIGHTPNPCIACNRYVKWGALLEKSRALGADYIATGHYAKIAHLPNGRWALQDAADSAKDQTYALYNLTQEQLFRTLMPDGAYTKQEIREIAEKIGLVTAHKADSQEICFVPDHDYASFLVRYTGEDDVPGNFVSETGEILGIHKGIRHYTIGQRKGLGIAFGRPVYVVAIRPETNEVVLGDNADLMQNELFADRLNFMAIDGVTEPIRAMAKIRYNHRGASCTIEPPVNGRIRIVFDEPQRAVTPGQAVVWYKDSYVLGGGTII